ncbi:MAG: hypothetical protein DRI46_10935, partial [Chloroflexi bacterium]
MTMPPPYDWMDYLTSPEPYSGYKRGDYWDVGSAWDKMSNAFTSDDDALSEAAKTAVSAAYRAAGTGLASIPIALEDGGQAADEFLRREQEKNYKPTPGGAQVLQDIGASPWVDTASQGWDKVSEGWGEIGSLHSPEAGAALYAGAKALPVAVGGNAVRGAGGKVSNLLDESAGGTVKNAGKFNQGGMWAGPRAKGADLVALDKAKQMKQSGAGRDAVKAQTGWAELSEGDWVYQIPDTGFMRKPRSTGKVSGKFGDFYEHDKGFAAYPELADVPFVLDELPGSAQGAYYPQDSRRHGIQVDPSSDIDSIAAHEGLAHAVQDIETRVGGTSPAQAGQYRAKRIGELEKEMEGIAITPEYAKSQKEARESLLDERSFPDLSFKEKADLQRDARSIARLKTGYKDKMDQRQALEDASPLGLYQKDWGEAEARDVQSSLDDIRAMKEVDIPDADIDAAIKSQSLEFDRPFDELLDVSGYMSSRSGSASAGDPNTHRKNMQAINRDIHEGNWDKLGAANVNAGKKRGRDGRYVGSGPDIKSPQKKGALVRKYDERTQNALDAGIEPGYFYQGGREAFSDVSKDPAAHQRIADAMGPTSAQVGPAGNLNFAIKALEHESTGSPITTGLYPNTIRGKLQDLVSDLDPWQGYKVGRYANLLGPKTKDRDPLAMMPPNDMWEG